MKKILFIINLLFCFNLCSDVPEGIFIKTNAGIKPIEKFSIYEKVISYNGGQFKDVSIKSIAKYKSKDFVAVQTTSGIFCCGTEAKVFSVSKNKFVKSTDLDVTDTLLSFDLKEYPIQEVVIFESDEENNFLIFSLEAPHAFFMCDSKGTPFLMHNNHPILCVLELFIERAPEILEIAASSTLALFGAKIAHNNSNHRFVLDEQRKAEIRQKHIESLQDKVRWGKATHEDIETLHLLEDYPEISYEELNRRIEENRKYREANILNTENLIKKLGKDGYEQLIKYIKLTNQIKSNTPNNNVNLNNDVLEVQKDLPKIPIQEDDKSEDKESGKIEDVKDPSVNDPIIDNVLQGAERESNTGGPSTIFSKSGGTDQAEKDFDQIEFDKVEIKINKKGKTIKVGYLSNGDKVVRRDDSSDEKKRPTIEFQKKDSPDKIKIRYE